MMKSILTGTLLLLFSFAFGQSNLSNAEYYIDHDPGYGNATPIVISGDTTHINELITNTLELGIHTFYIRAQNDQGTWGMDEAVPFLIREQFEAQETFQIDYAEYFLNIDPGYGLATEIDITTGDTIFISEILTNDINPGFNTLFIRTRNANNQWGIDASFNFYVQATYTATQGNQDQIVGMEYFIGDDPGNGNGTYVDLIPGDTLQINEWLASQALIDGVHQLSLRLQSDSGTWSLTEWRDFEYLNCEDDIVNITGDTDFCIGDSILIEGPEGYDLWSWNTHQNDSQIYASQSGEYYVVVYDSTINQCSLSDTLNALMFLPPDASFSYTSSFNTIDASASAEGQNLFWQLNDEFSSMEDSFTYNFLEDGWQSICLEASNICGVDEFCDTLLVCADYETAPYYFMDNDGDGYGVATDSIKACSAPDGFADNILDCNDEDEFINPDAVEIPNDGIDQNCDGLDIVTGIGETAKNQFFLFPNPANEFVTIQFSNDFTGTIQLYNSSGKMIIELKRNSVEETIINIENLRPGIYYLRLSTTNDTATKKLIIL